MSKKAGADSNKTRNNLIEAGKREFRAMGYQKASLRHICSDADVTTGALYFFFRDKDDLFGSILSEVTIPFMDIISQHYAFEENGEGKVDGEGSDQKATEMMIDFYYEKKDVFDILLSSLDHPIVKSFFDNFIYVSTEHYMKVLGKDSGIEEFPLHMFLHMQLDMMISLVSHGFEKEEMKKHAATGTTMLRGAFRSLLKVSAI